MERMYGLLVPMRNELRYGGEEVHLYSNNK